LITGGSRGIGRAAAVHFASTEGARLWLLGRDRSALEDAAREVGRSGGTAHALLGDVTERERLCALAHDLPHLDVVVVAAGISDMTPVDEDSDATFDQVLAIDLTGAWNTVRAFFAKMREGGRIVLVSSVLGRFGVPGYGAYCAAKHGLIGLGKALAL